ncbi:histidine phosphatase family protein [Nakamurella sp. YIM 132087]|uniref:Histidine phosphatase family protein n=1 Tax=Nakamurella alba TaxID=2665158 RepID=A0A7K1FLA5_9ACTN|nr:histidine phosphatase family protein [Nakamurella alba]MTD14927.1 histidine phosphatase family protein [Nakamurella alba]
MHPQDPADHGASDPPTRSGAAELWLVRHGESTGNVAATAAQAAGAEVIEIGQRDADVPLTSRGAEQAAALGAWMAGLDPGALPQAVWCSPYLRARQTAQLALDATGSGLRPRVDERLRDRELGVLDLLTAVGVERRFPQEAARRRWWGKFYYRPPGGEAWTDVVLRLRSLLRDIDDAHPGGRVLLVAHDAVILLLRYVCEQLDEDQLLEIARTHTVVNASVTQLTRAGDGISWNLASFNAASHLESAGATVTEHAGDTDVAPR